MTRSVKHTRAVKMLLLAPSSSTLSALTCRKHVCRLSSLSAGVGVVVVVCVEMGDTRTRRDQPM